MAKTTTLEVYKDKKGEYRFKLIAKNGEAVASSSEGYDRKASAMNAAKKLAEWAQTAEIIDVEKVLEIEAKLKEKEKKEAAKATTAKKTVATKVVAKAVPVKKAKPVAKTADELADILDKQDLGE